MARAERTADFNLKINLASEKTDYSSMSELDLEAHQESCNQSWQELRGGKLYSCNYAAYATVAGIVGEQDLEEVYDLTGFRLEKKKELVEFPSVLSWLYLAKSIPLYATKFWIEWHQLSSGFVRSELPLDTSRMFITVTLPCCHLLTE